MAKKKGKGDKTAQNARKKPADFFLSLKVPTRSRHRQGSDKRKNSLPKQEGGGWPLTKKGGPWEDRKLTRAWTRDTDTMPGTSQGERGL